MGEIPVDGLIAICAFRYALGRMTYVVDHVADWLIANRELLSAHDRALIVNEIEEARRMMRSGLPLSNRWVVVLEAMTRDSPP